MIQKLKTMLFPLIASLTLAVPFLVTGVVATTGLAHAQSAACSADASTNTTCPSTAVCDGATNLSISGNSANDNQPGSTNTCNSVDETSTLNNIISTVLNIFSVVVGIIAVLMIIYAGFKYITSGGKEEGVKTAKNTILYAIIGLVIVALAQVIVKFVLAKSVNSSAGATQ